MTKFFAVSFFCIFVCAGCTDKPSSREYEKSFSRTVLTHAAFAVLTEHPSATNVLLCGEKIFKMAPYFKSAGVNAATNAAAGALFDAVIVDSDAKDSVKALSHLAEGGLFSVLLDVEKTTMSALRAEIVAFPMGGDASHLWMFGEYDWMITGRKEKVKSPLDGVFEIFGSESAFPDLAAVRIESAADIFASYCGPLVQIYGGFDTGGLDAPARPEFFLTKEVQNIDWLDDGGIDADVAAGFYSRARTAQIVRRLVMEGLIHSHRGETDAAIDAWSRANLRNRGDALLLERRSILERNADAFKKLGNFKGAAKCFETLILIDPKDVHSLREYATLTRRLGMKDVSKLADERADRVEKSSGVR